MIERFKRARIGQAAIVLGAIAAVCLAAPQARGEDICGSGNYTFVVPDGRIFASTIPATTTFGFVIGSNIASGGQPRSYSIEVRNPNNGFTNPPTLFVRNDGACTTAHSVTVNDTALYEARVGCDGCSSSTGKRYSVTTTDRFLNLVVGNAAASPINYTISVSETTQFSPAWSTNSTYDTFYSLMNTTSGTCSGTLTLYDTSGAVITTTGVVVTSGATLATNTFALGTTRNKSGTARLTHNCPPGGILSEAAIANFSISPPYFQFVHIEPTRATQH